MSQPTTCFCLFSLGHLQVGYLSQRKCTKCSTTIEVRGDEISFTKMGRVHKLVVPPDFNGCIVLCAFHVTKVSNLKMA